MHVTIRKLAIRKGKTMPENRIALATIRVAFLKNDDEICVDGKVNIKVDSCSLPTPDEPDRQRISEILATLLESLAPYLR